VTCVVDSWDLAAVAQGGDRPPEFPRVEPDVRSGGPCVPVLGRVTIPAPRGRSRWWPAEERAGGWLLVSAVQAGDREAFGRLYLRYEPSVRAYFRRAYFRRQLRDHATVEDLTSETFLRVLRRIDTFHDHGIDFVFMVLLNARDVLSDHLNRARVRREFAAETIPEPTTTAGSPEQVVLAQFDRDAISLAVHTGLGQLSLSRRRCLQLYYLEGRSTAEVAAELGRKNMRRHARAQLAEQLDPGGGPGPHRYARAVERARTAHQRARLPRAAPVALSAEQVALAACQTKAEALQVAWGFLGVPGTPRTADVPPAVGWLATHGIRLSVRWAYAVRRALVARDTGGV
jgi:RNA polymerase sigma factor (sigma-70 family)